MRINKISKSDSFDLYSHVLSDFLSKKNNLEIKTAGILPTVFRLFGKGGDYAKEITESLRGGGRIGSELKKLINDLPDDASKLADGTKLLDPTNPKTVTLWGDVLKSIDDAAEAATIEAKQNFSPEIIKIFWGSEENLKLYYKRIMLKQAGESKITGLQKLTSFGDLYNDEIASINGMLANSPIESSADVLEIYKRFAMRVGDNPRLLKKTPKDIDELKRLLDIDSEDLSRGLKLLDELKEAEEINAKAIEDISKKLDKAIDTGNVNQVIKIKQELEQAISSSLKGIEDRMKAVEEAVKNRSISKEQGSIMKENLKGEAEKIKKYIENTGLLSKITKLFGGTIKTIFLSKLTIAAGLLASGYYGLKYLGLDDEGSEVSQSELTELRQSNKVTISPEKVEAERAFESENEQDIQRLLSDPNIRPETLEFITNKYRKDKAYKLPQPFDGMTYVFMSDEPGGLDIDDPGLYEANLDLLIDALNNPKTGLPIYTQEFLPSSKSKQHALNDASQRILEDGLYRKRRSKRYQLGRGTAGRKGVSGFESKDLPREIRKIKKQRRKESSKENGDRMRKISYLKEISSNSTNNHLNNDTNMLKKADEISKSYVKDAVKDLNHEDKTLREYFTGLGRLYDAESEKRNPDKKELYQLHDETGRDLTLSAHPKAIRLSDAMGDGGLVENGLEQKEKMEMAALRTPTGNFESRYAKLKNLFNKSSKT